MEPNRKQWNEGQQALNRALSRPADFDTAIHLFLRQHAMVHAAAMSGAGLWSFADEVWDGAAEATLRCIPPKGEHSIAWVIWHLARIEDVTMNLLAADCPQVFEEGDWLRRTRSPIRHTGNVMTDAEVKGLSDSLDLDALRAYRVAVGRRTREIAGQLGPDDLKKKVEPARLRRIWEQGAVLEGAREIVDYWSRRTIAGLLKMPPTRHNFLHLNEAARIRKQCR